MRPITREVVERRQPHLRWSAVIAGAIVAIALWVLLQMLGMGAGLASIDVDNAGSLRSVSIGTTVWTLVAPLVALFIGGIVSGRIATTSGARSGAMHGFVTWAIASMVGLCSTVMMIGMLTAGPRHMATAGLQSEDIFVHPSARSAELQEAAQQAGSLLLGGGISLGLGLVTAVLGGALGARRSGRPRRGRQVTQEVPVVPPPEPPPEAPHVVRP